jgi:hypothetical protein
MARGIPNKKKEDEKPIVDKEQVKEVPIKAEDINNINTLDDKLNAFVSTAGKSKVAIIVPLFGYWNTVKKNQLNSEMLKLVMDRVYTELHELYIVLVADPARVPTSIVKAMESKSFGGNVVGISVAPGASYSDYIDEGMFYALNETKSQFIVIINPWIIIQHGAIDRIVGRVNRGDVAFVSGYDVTGDIKQDKFDEISANSPQEFRDLDLNFTAMIRPMAEMIQFGDIKTSSYFTKDLLQYMYRKGYEAITSQVVPIYTFDINITNYEEEEEYVNDRILFIKKWGFDPDVE